MIFKFFVNSCIHFSSSVIECLSLFCSDFNMRTVPFSSSTCDFNSANSTFIAELMLPSGVARSIGSVGSDFTVMRHFAILSDKALASSLSIND